ncbi:MAG TPA: hypothetical protein ENF49_00340 [Candidatus Altiarchaeales archaeon]|nr:hypothetical protein [Candidatus Altiarchaeales archaeon]HEX54567.1 hypothetical protein [Candidatus Altiarchaeales archaeon]
MRKSEKEYLCYGIRSLTEDGKHVILTDWDDIDITTIRKSLGEQISKRKLSDFFIMRNSDKERHYHAICSTKISYEEYLEILDELSSYGLDPKYSHQLRNWSVKSTVMMFASEKGCYVIDEILESKYRNHREMSLAHLYFLKILYGVDINRYTNVDGFTRVWIDSYHTRKNG